uniref:Uncharacterized protein n=1 Tax=Aureoumbra lagunensis TaxID=44058 RepID=A0A7S3NP63_9STRA|mmetsp:Transcript_11920/g.14925  ORF Transcript_11920/g.14925 Transcript_11920/m.14925 type:complete len:293 (-) Transcript_11920:360-1238(-)
MLANGQYSQHVGAGGDFFFGGGGGVGHGQTMLSNVSSRTRNHDEKMIRGDQDGGENTRSLPRDAYEVAELQDCRQHLRLCAERISELEQLNIDLESRLEEQANEYVKLESEAAESQRRWKEQFEHLERECELWRNSNSQLELKNQQLRNQLLRTEKELHGILQKKYEFMELARQEERERIKAEQDAQLRENNVDQKRAGGAQQLNSLQHKPPSAQLYEAAVLKHDEYHLSNNNLQAKSTFIPGIHAFPRNQNPHSAAPEEVRRGRAILALADFFGISNRHALSTGGDYSSFS